MSVVNRQDQGQADVVVFETAAGLDGRDRRQLVLYVVSLFGVKHSSGEEISGDALLVRPRGTSDQVLLSAILDCEIEEVAPLVADTGRWVVREVTEIDGHRLWFEPNQAHRSSRIR